MQIDYLGPEIQITATDCVVVVDVWRSFTTSAYAFAAGAHQMIVVASEQEALSLHSQIPAAIVMGMGRLGGEPAAGFDYGNSPADIQACDLRGQSIIFCTPNGTPGLVRSANARTLVAGSFVCANATIRYIQQQRPERVAFVCTEPGIADQAYAEYMAMRLRDETPDAATILDQICTAGLEHARKLISQGKLTQTQADRLEADLNCCLALDRFDFAMVAQPRDGYLVLEDVKEPGDRHLCQDSMIF
jgi:2-phosphosulfolactate phosphatase